MFPEPVELSAAPCINNPMPPPAAVPTVFARRVMPPLTVAIEEPASSVIDRPAVRLTCPVPLVAMSLVADDNETTPTVEEVVGAVLAALAVKFLSAAIVTVSPIVIPAPVVKSRLFPCVIAALTEIVPLFISPIVSVPAVMRSSSPSFRPSVFVPSAPPKSIAVPLVFCRTVAPFVPAVIVAAPPITMLLPTRVIEPVPTAAYGVVLLLAALSWTILQTALITEHGPDCTIAIGS